MSITKEQVADLREGDVVELTSSSWAGAVMRGPLVEDDWGDLCVGRIGMSYPGRGFVVRHADGSPNRAWAHRHSLTVVSRAPRPLYVNHPRTEPVPGDVVRDADGQGCAIYYISNAWTDRRGASLPLTRGIAGLRLLVDGETGQVVP